MIGTDPDPVSGVTHDAVGGCQDPSTVDEGSPAKKGGIRSFAAYPHMEGELSVSSWFALVDSSLGHVYILKSRRDAVAKLQNEN